MNKKRFTEFLNYLEGFTQRIVTRFPESGDFVNDEKREMLERFPELAYVQQRVNLFLTRKKHIKAYKNFLCKYIITIKMSTEIAEIVNQLRGKIKQIEFILRYFEQKSLKPEEVQIVVDRQMKPIEFILNCPDEKKNENEFDQAIKIFRSDALNQCSRIKSILSRYNGNKYQKIKSEILHEINQIKSIAEYIVDNVINSHRSKYVSAIDSELGSDFV